jgi:multiple sugar transport system permease protein
MSAVSVVARMKKAQVAAGRRPRRLNLLPYLFLAPAMVLLLAFSVVPILIAAAVSLTDMDIAGLADSSNIRFVGLENYNQLFADPGFWQALTNTVLFTAVGVPAIVGISLIIALGLSRRDTPFFRALRAFYFLPSITAIVAISLIWGYLYNSQFGLLNYLLDAAGLPTVAWLSDPVPARISVGAVAVWRATGINIVIFLAAIQAIPREYYEAASLDGAGRFRQTVSITLPLLRFAIFFVTVTTVIQWLQFFDEPYVLTKGGPVDATTSLSLYVFQEGFRFNQFGFASAASIVLFGFIAVITAIQLKARGTDED